MGHQGMLDSIGGALGSSLGLPTWSKTINTMMYVRERIARIAREFFVQAILVAAKWPKKDVSTHSKYVI